MLTSGRKLRNSTVQRSLSSLEKVQSEKGKRKKVVCEDTDNGERPNLLQKRQKIEPSEEDILKTTRIGKTKLGRPPKTKRKLKQTKQSFTVENKNQGNSTPIRSVLTDQNQNLSGNDCKKSPKASTADLIVRETNQHQTKTENDKKKKFNGLKRLSSSKTPSPLVVGNILDSSSSSSVHLMDNEELLAFLEVLEGKENKDQNDSAEKEHCIKRLDCPSPSRFFECPLCYKVFTDGNLARSHLENSCPKLSS